MELRIGSSKDRKDVEDEPTKGNLAGGCCFDFNKVCLYCPVQENTLHYMLVLTVPATPVDDRTSLEMTKPYRLPGNDDRLWQQRTPCQVTLVCIDCTDNRLY